MRLIDVDALIALMQELDKLYKLKEEEAYYTGKKANNLSWNDAIYKIKTALTVEQCEDAVSRKDAIIQLSHNKNGDPDCDVIIQHDIETLKQLSPVTPKRKTMICGACSYSDSETLYVTNPPKIQCRKTGNLHFTTDTCECGVDMRGEQE